MRADADAVFVNTCQCDNAEQRVLGSAVPHQQKRHAIGKADCGHGRAVWPSRDAAEAVAGTGRGGHGGGPDLYLDRPIWVGTRRLDGESHINVQRRRPPKPTDDRIPCRAGPAQPGWLRSIMRGCKYFCSLLGQCPAPEAGERRATTEHSPTR